MKKKRKRRKKRRRRKRRRMRARRARRTTTRKRRRRRGHRTRLRKQFYHVSKPDVREDRTGSMKRRKRLRRCRLKRGEVV